MARSVIAGCENIISRGICEHGSTIPCLNRVALCQKGSKVYVFELIVRNFVEELFTFYRLSASRLLYRFRSQAVEACFTALCVGKERAPNCRKGVQHTPLQNSWVLDKPICSESKGRRRKRRLACVVPLICDVVMWFGSCRQPRLLICDEATSALDTAIERGIMDSLEVSFSLPTKPSWGDALS